MDYETIPEVHEPLSWAFYPVHNGPYTAHASTTLPLDADKLHFLAQGKQIGGRFEVSQTLGRGGDVAHVDIEAEYYHERALDEITVCTFWPTSQANMVTLGIYRTHRVDPSLPLNRNISITIHVRFPAPAAHSNDRLQLNTLGTSLRFFSHHLHRLADKIHFQNVSLESFDCPIHAESMAADRIQLVTCNSPIRGTYDASKQLEMKTSNASILIVGSVIKGQNTDTPSINLRTSNGPIQASLRLLASPEYRQSEGHFDVLAHTSNAPLSISIDEQPPNSTLRASLQTSNSPANVRLHPAFEGRYELRGFAFLPPRIAQTTVAVQDPAGTGRTRRITQESARPGVVRGRAWWEPLASNELRDGRVEVQTSNAPAFLAV